MSKLILTLLVLGIFPLSTVGSYSDYTNSIVHCVSSPFRQTIDFLTEVWSYFVDIICYPFFALLDGLKMMVNTIQTLITSLINGIATSIELVVVRPLTFVVTYFYRLTDCVVRYPLIFVTNMTASAAGLFYDKAIKFEESDKVVNLFAQMLAFPADALVDILQLAVFLVVQMPINVIFYGVIEYLIAGTLLLLVSWCQAILYFLIDICRLPFVGINYLLKGVFALPLISLLNVLNFILFCIIDPVIYFIYLVISTIKISVLIACLTILMIYLYNYSVSGHQATLTMNGLQIAALTVIRKLTRVAKKLLVVNNDQTLTEIMEEEEEDKCCAVCFEERLLAKLVPCKHENTCMGCVYQIMRLDGRCPICRTPIQNVEY